ncbi:MAG TPA: prepilin peptidase [Myxococcota bacterium]|nr:prepilin peptidase [Myxococcota bacterium]HQK49672.1 prepilin peptidase [Myxococcota bacterium]
MPDSVDGVPFVLLKVTVLLLGAAIGSFANVLIHRIPAELSIVRPPSACPRCGHPIRWHDNIPVLGWVLLLGRCRDCKAPISLRYPLVELVTAVLSLACLYLAVLRGGGVPGVWGLLTLWFFPFAFVVLLLVLAFIDLDHWVLPHALTVPGIVLGVVQALLFSDFPGVPAWWESLAAAAAGALPVVILMEVWVRCTGREGMGFGDAMLMAMAGAYLGLAAIPFLFLAASLQGILVSVPLVATARWRPVPPWEGEGDQGPSSGGDGSEATASSHEGIPGTVSEPRKGLGQVAVPFGPFIVLAALEWLFFGEALRAWLLPF